MNIFISSPGGTLRSVKHMYHIHFKIHYKDNTLLEDTNILNLSLTFMNVLLLMMLILYSGGGKKTFRLLSAQIRLYIKEFVTR